MQAGLSLNLQKLSLFAGSWTPPARKIHMISRRRNPLKPNPLENDEHKTCEETMQEIRMCCMVYQLDHKEDSKEDQGDLSLPTYCLSNIA